MANALRVGKELPRERRLPRPIWTGDDDTAGFRLSRTSHSAKLRAHFYRPPFRRKHLLHRRYQRFLIEPTLGV